MNEPLRIDVNPLVGKQAVEALPEAWNGICDCPKYPKTHPAHLSGGSVYTPGKTRD